MADFTTEQTLPVSAKVVDGRGRPKAIDGEPVIASSDETVVTVSDVVNDGNGGITFNVNSVAAGSARVTVTADADISPEINEIVGVLDVNVTLDPRTAARTIELAPGTPTDD